MSLSPRGYRSYDHSYFKDHLDRDIYKSRDNDNDNNYYNIASPSRISRIARTYNNIIYSHQVDAQSDGGRDEHNVGVDGVCHVSEAFDGQVQQHAGDHPDEENRREGA